GTPQPIACPSNTMVNNGDARSPRPGMSDRIGSIPKRMFVPGIRNRSSSQEAQNRSARTKPMVVGRGPLDPRTFGPLDPWTLGPLDLWTLGPLDRHNHFMPDLHSRVA